MDETKFKHWIENILATEEEEISCTECFDQVSAYVDAELTGVEMPGDFRQVKQHIDQCLACRDEYELLRDFVRLETEDLDPSRTE